MISGGQNTELKNLSRESIAVALLQLMEKQPYSKISITAICNRAGVSRNAFYRNYPTKDEIIRRYMFQITYEYRQQLREKYGYTISAIIVFTELFRHMDRNRQLFLNALQDDLSYILIDAIFLAFREYYYAQKASSYEHACYAGAFYAMCVDWIGNNRPDSPEQMGKEYCRINGFAEDQLFAVPELMTVDQLMKFSHFKYREQINS